MRYLIIVKYIFIALASIFALLFGAAYSMQKYIKYHNFIKKLSLKKPPLFFISCFFIVSASVLGILIDTNNNKPIEVIILPRNKITTKATLTKFEQELEYATHKMKSKTKDYFALAESDFNSMHYQKAAINYQNSIDILPTMSAYLNLGISLDYTSVSNDANKAYLSGLRLARDKQDKLFESIFLANIGVNQVSREKALKYLNEALRISREFAYRETEASCLGNIGLIHFADGHINEAIKYYKESLKIYQKKKGFSYSLGEVIGLSLYGRALGEKGKIDEALKYNNKALTICKEINYKWGEIDVLNNIGKIYEDQGKIDKSSLYSEKALQYYEDAFNISKDINYKLGEAISLNNMGQIYHRQKKFDKALSYYDKALTTFKESKDNGGEIVALLNISNVYMKQDKIDRALQYANKALMISKQLGDVQGEIGAFLSMGLIYKGQGKKNEALKHFHKALEMSKKFEIERVSKNIETTIKEIEK